MGVVPADFLAELMQKSNAVALEPLKKSRRVLGWHGCCPCQMHEYCPCVPSILNGGARARRRRVSVKARYRPNPAVLKWLQTMIEVANGLG